MAHNPIRRSQLISPHGVGSMLVIKGGVSVITCGLDHWYERESMDGIDIDVDEFKVEEYRLQCILGVDHFRLPPDYRERHRGSKVRNYELTLPFLRFPRWHICSRCGGMEEKPLTLREIRIRCKKCEQQSKYGFMQQAVFVGICERGHLQDFPWREWVHGMTNPCCNGSLRFVTSGGATLAAQRVKCDCGKERSLARITEAEPDGSTILSKTLESGKIFLCRGQRPWLGTNEGEPCQNHLRGSLRGATNVWFSGVHSAIYLPQGTEKVPSELVEFLRTPDISGMINIAVSSGMTNAQLIDLLRKPYSFQLKPYEDEQIINALKIIRGEEQTNDQTGELLGDDTEIAFRRAEFNVLCTEREENKLVTRTVNLKLYEPEIAKYFSRIVLVHKLLETRVFSGFSRIYAEQDMPLAELKRMLRLNTLDVREDWLPANVVYGEGIFLELNEELLQEWEDKNHIALQKHLENLRHNFDEVQRKRGLRPKNLSPRFILLHTLAHLLINRLTFECGYNSASLRERLYVSENPKAKMAGLLIYTADGDSEGTMGGLVRMGNPKFFEPVLRRAIESAEWCSADPVCREMGAKSGQGPDSCNLAACHSCALLPETSCEEFNRFLDRSVIANNPNGEGFAFFDLS